MASGVDCELTSAVTSSPGDKTIGEGESIHNTPSSGLPQSSVSENEKKTETPSSPQTGNVPCSKPETTKTVDEEKVNKPVKDERDVGSSGDSSPDIGSEDKEEKTETHISPQTGNVPCSQPETTKTVDEEKVNKPVKDERGSIHNTASSGLPQSSVSENEKKTETPSSPQTGNVPCSKPETTKTVDEEKVNKLVKDERDAGSSGDSSPDIGSEDKEEKTETHISPQTGNVPCSQPETTKTVDEEKVNKPVKDERGSIHNTPSSGLPQSSVSENEKKTETPSSPQTGNVPCSKPETTKTVDEEKVNKPVKDERDVGSSGDSSPDIGSEDKEEPLQHTTPSGLPQERQPQISVGGNKKLLWIGAFAVIFVSVVCAKIYVSDSTPPVSKEFNVVDIFNQEMEKLKNSFPNQHPELWRRSLIHLRRHLKTEHPTEPVSLILTSGHKAERTLGCLARCLAQAFSTARNSSVLNINGTSKASQDSDQVKLDIDSELRNAFGGKTFAAVIHRFEELPPGSTLIFYRYCDHENAAYKDVFLAFTVMLDAEMEVPSNVNLGRVEEMVQERVKQKFVSSDKLAMFNEMDVDKLSGLWSRISHLILPVAAEETIEHQGCVVCDKSCLNSS